MSKEEIEREIEEYIYLHKDEPLRTIKAGIKKTYGKSLGLTKIANKRKKFLEITGFELEADVEGETIGTVEGDPEILEMKKKIELEQLSRQYELELMDTKTLEELKEENSRLIDKIFELESKLKEADDAREMAKKTAAQTWKTLQRLKETPCPVCAGKHFERHVTGKLYKCIVCGSYIDYDKKKKKLHNLTPRQYW